MRVSSRIVAFSLDLVIYPVSKIRHIHVHPWGVVLPAADSPGDDPTLHVAAVFKL